VYFKGKDPSNAEGAIGIEVEIQKKNNIYLVESKKNRRFKILEYDPDSNFAMAQPYKDEDSIPLLTEPQEND